MLFCGYGKKTGAMSPANQDYWISVCEWLFIGVLCVSETHESIPSIMCHFHRGQRLSFYVFTWPYVTSDAYSIIGLTFQRLHYFLSICIFLNKMVIYYN